MRSLAAKAFEDIRFWGSKYIIDPMDLIKFIFARKQRFFSDKFEEHTAKSPDVHFLIVIAISHEALGSPVPACGYIIRVGCGGVLPLT